jgi:non-ribosomal peptide synthetase component F
MFNITSDDILANQAPFDFDVSVKDIYSSISVGATLVIVPKTYFSSPAKLLDYLCEHNVTTMIWAVSALCLITTFHGLDYKVPEKVRKILFSGEVMPIKHLNIWMNHLNKCEFINVYGPTEITCNCTYHIIDRKRKYEDISEKILQ